MAVLAHLLHLPIQLLSWAIAPRISLHDVHLGPDALDALQGNDPIVVRRL